MACNCPVLCSNKSCFPEVVGDAGLFFDPYKIDDIYEKMNYLLDTSDYRNYLIIQGKERVKLYSWNKTREEHDKLYKSLI